MEVKLDDNGAWAKVKDVSELRKADRRAVNAAIVFETDPVTSRPILHGSIEDDMYAAVAAQVVTNWSLPFPLPSVDPSSLDKLTLEQDDALSEALQPLLDAIRGRNAPVRENEAPTAASAS